MMTREETDLFNGRAQRLDDCRQEIALLRAQLAAAQADSRRLDWLDRNRFGLFPGMPKSKHDYWFIRTYKTTPVEQATGDDPRAAIDAAMRPPDAE